MYDVLLKIIVLGESNVGKTSLLQKFFENKDLSVQVPTIGVDFFTSILKYNNKKVKLQIWDTAGQEIFKSIISHYYKIAIGALVIFDLSSYTSFENCEYWIKEYLNHRSYSKILIIGNKSDLLSKVPENEIKTLCDKYGCNYLECSLINNNSLEYIFLKLIEEIFNDYNNNIFDEKETGFCTDKNKALLFNNKNDSSQKCCTMS